MMVKSIKEVLDEAQRARSFTDALVKNSAAQDLKDAMKSTGAGLAAELAKTLAAQDLKDSMRKTQVSIPDFSSQLVSPMERFNIPEPMTHEETNEYQSASAFMEALAADALQWKKDLPNNYRPAIMAFIYGGAQINVESLSQVSFHGIRITGTLKGNPCSLLAHQSTVQMLCYGEEIVEDATRNPIGFVWADNSIEV